MSRRLHCYRYVLVRYPRAVAVGYLLMILLVVTMGCKEGDASAGNKEKHNAAVPVMTAPVVRGTIDAVRTFSGSLEAGESVVVASKVGGLVKKVAVDIGDEVLPGQLLVRIDDAEYQQALAQAKADLQVAKANLQEAVSALEISSKIRKRTEELKKRGVASESQLDELQTEQVRLEAQQAVYEATVIRARATVKQAKIKLAWATVKSDQFKDGIQRFVAERFVDEGAVVVENTPLLRTVSLAPVKAAFYVPEAVYAAVKVGQTVQVETDAYGAAAYDGTVSRMAPVFDKTTRQARVEVEIPNTDLQLKPGMFVRVQVQVDSVDDTAIVPAAAVVQQSGVEGIYVLGSQTNRVKWCPVALGIRQKNKVEVRGQCVSDRVVVLGQELLEDGVEVAARPMTTEER